MKALKRGGIVAAGIAVALLLSTCGGAEELFQSVEERVAEAVSVETYSVTYDGNGKDSGTVPVDDRAYQEGAMVSVLGNTGGLQREDHAFVGWNTEPGGDGTSYTSGRTFMMGAQDVTLFAQWNQSVHSLMFDKNDAVATGSMPNVDLAEGQVVNLPACDFAKVNWVFAGWSTTGSGTVQYSDEDTYTMGTSDSTLFAQWEPTFDVAYDGNGSTSGSVPIDTARYSEGDFVTVGGNPGGLENIDGVTAAHFFDGWEDNSGAVFYEGETFSMPSHDVTLRVNWSPYGIGDEGPATGVVFYDKGSYSDEWRYLEAAPYDQSSGIRWGTEDLDITGDADYLPPELLEIGYGKSNTYWIVLDDPDDQNAATECQERTSIGGKQDWFLPSYDEIAEMQKFKNIIGGFSERDYWSSTEDSFMDGYGALGYDFLAGQEIRSGKSGQMAVRAVRRF